MPIVPLVHIPFDVALGARNLLEALDPVDTSHRMRYTAADISEDRVKILAAVDGALARHEAELQAAEAKEAEDAKTEADAALVHDAQAHATELVASGQLGEDSPIAGLLAKGFAGEIPPILAEDA